MEAGFLEFVEISEIRVAKKIVRFWQEQAFIGECRQWTT
jgi:hypothetical protein